ncbi:hypothetical protein ACFLUU_03205 [Chloroflexota bacterium]
MVRFLKQFLSGEKGQGLLIVLCLLAIGGLTIAVSLNFATTNLKGNRIIEEGTKGIYAAGAGVEHALWCLQEGLSSPPEGETTSNTTPENINQMAVNIQTENQGSFSLYCGELLEEAGPHVDWISVVGDIVGDEGATCNYTITVTRQEYAEGNIGLIEVGATLPVGYFYESGSAALFPDNLSTADPSSNGTTPVGAQWIKWEWKPGKGPELTPDNMVQTQEFQITGIGSLEGDYAWVEAQAQAIGMVGEISGTRYIITSTATRPEDGRITAKIVAGIMIVGGDTQIISWQITK